MLTLARHFNAGNWFAIGPSPTGTVESGTYGTTLT